MIKSITLDTIWIFYVNIYWIRTCSKINNDIYKKYGVGKTIKGDPARAEVIVEEGDGNWQDDQVGHEQQ